MGNRAVITDRNRDLGIYLHWNGGYDSVDAFLDYCRIHNFRTPEKDPYGWARLTQVIANFFGPDGLSIGIQPYTSDINMSPGDNGIYVIKDWQIVDRIDAPTTEQHSKDHLELLIAIDKAQPLAMQLGSDNIAKQQRYAKRT